MFGVLTKSLFPFIKGACHNKQLSGDKSSASPDEKIYQQPKFSAFDGLFLLQSILLELSIRPILYIFDLLRFHKNNIDLQE